MRKQTLVTVHLLVNSTDENEIADGLSALLTETGGQPAYGQPHLITDWAYPYKPKDGESSPNGYAYGRVISVADEANYEEGEFTQLIK